MVLKTYLHVIRYTTPSKPQCCLMLAAGGEYFSFHQSTGSSLIKSKFLKLGEGTHTCNRSTWQAEAGG